MRLPRHPHALTADEAMRELATSPETTMHLPKSLTFDDVLDALACRRYRVAGVIGFNLVRNKLSATNSVRHSKQTKLGSRSLINAVGVGLG